MRRKQILHWSYVLLWMGIIFFFSAQPGSTSGSLSGSVLKKLLAAVHFILPHLHLNMEMAHLFLRKTAHFTVYLILGILTSRALTTSGWSRKQQIYGAFIICLLYACSDEWHQSFVPGRGPSIRDVFIDSLGSATGIGSQRLIHLLLLKKNKKFV